MEKTIGCLFDIDGVIIDSETQYSMFWDEIEKIYPTGIPNYSMVIKGSNLPSILHKYYPDEQARKEILHRLEIFEGSMPLDIFPGVIDFLEELKAASIPCVVVTSSTKEKMDRLYSLHPELKQYFVGTINGDMVTHPKPNPECYIKGAEMIDTDILKCIVFEDSINGLKAGKASGARVMALSTTLPEERLKTMEPEMIIPSFVGFHISSLLK